MIAAEFAQKRLFVGAKHDRSEYKIITNNLYAVMLRPLQKPDAPGKFEAGAIYSSKVRCGAPYIS
ncbi:MAG: hypothetical protein EAZ19_23425 [Oscillatoriales cyanobacterium]|nr:MAG: hypothetical protein EAZ19_23425 [Oscillatoriales cyanobacterium]